MNVLSISNSITTFVAGVGVLQGMLLAGLLYFHPKSDRSVNKFLGLYIASLSLIMLGPFILLVMPWQQTFFLEPLPFIPGPLMYLYIRSFKETITWKKALPHVAIFFIWFVVAYFRVDYLANAYPGSKEIPPEALASPFGAALVLLRYAQLILYYFLSRNALNKYQRSIKHLFSETSKINQQWTRFLINGYMLIVIISIAIYVLMTKFPQYFDELYFLNIAFATPFVYICAYYGITQPTIWQKLKGSDKQKLEEELRQTKQLDQSKKQREEKQEVSDNRFTEIISRITSVMEKDKLYQETELTLQDLADKLQFPSYQISQAINEGMNKSFYELINNYRVEEAKRLLIDEKNRNYTVLSVGFEAGFNSKTTFNTVFKKFTGLTPTAYREQQKETARSVVGNRLLTY